ncbi:MAG TPA: class I adenylate-forming enzyme family protein [Leptospiraceae bacterium]|nr:class I adenylate-forming enzyme family protein [Leptospiraceae bacterium]HMX32237.1 class I adenylate-forming enzyme family protein [Leptospiraceae bacterium]HMY32380.1 class I adenylate-forming enzyme family protein [Leptospiraceae bacterium]HNB99833.1 class I adenylate-forming enzyme family protein [Leptospiraceae bacterium]HNC58357.1 class I adenylate-forming enzyme family protein [Leptospiraceae bacterium]
MPLQDLIFERLKEKPHPLFIFKDTIIPAATIWIGVRAWVNFFRENGIKSGDRILLAYPESPAFLHILYAAIWEKLTIAIIRADNLDLPHINKIKPSLIISNKQIENSISPDEMGMPPKRININKKEIPSDPKIRFILQSSGSTGNPKYICLSEESIEHVIQTHSKIIESSKSISLSILPWSHCFGLVLDLFLTTFYSDTIIRDSRSGRDIDSIFENFEKYHVTHFSSVPLVIERILAKEKGIQLLSSLESGIIGGAPISKKLSESLSSTKLRVGYGQTEASPGICLGEKGFFRENYLGSELGCDVILSDSHELLFRGKNAFLGYWKGNSIEYIPNNSWIRSGDIVEKKQEGYFFRGRLDFAFKLPNGLMIQPEELEESLAANSDLSQCLLYFKDKVYIFYNSKNKTSKEDSILKNIPTILKNYVIQITQLPETNWFYSPKGGIDRKKMLTSLNLY